MNHKDVVLCCALATMLNSTDVLGAEITLTWTAPGDDSTSGQAAVYDLRYSLSLITDATWSTATRATGLPVPKFAGSKETLLVTGLQPATTYYFALKSADEVPNWSALSSVAVRTTPTVVPSTPALASPSSGSGGLPTNATLEWNPSSGASSYRAQVSQDSTFATTSYNANDLIGTSVSVSGLEYNRKYFWRVSASNSSGTSPYSAVWSFTTVAEPPPAAPTLASPSNGSTGVPINPILVWNSTSGASNYHIQISTGSSFVTLLSDMAGLIDTTFSGAGLKYNTTYYWHVRASNAGGVSAYSLTGSFKTDRKRKFSAIRNNGVARETSDSTADSTVLLSQNFPNPFNPTTTIEFSLPEEAGVRLEIINMEGRVVAELLNRRIAAGTHQAQWNASGYSSGVYLYRLTTDDFVTTRKMVLLK